VRGFLGDVARDASRAAAARGEHVIVVGPAPPASEVDDGALDDAARDALAAGATTRDAAASVARELGVSKRRAYDAVLRMR
jgi:16S rRNA C1402 (ribose-2'-O) methylase RsmI